MADEVHKALPVGERRIGAHVAVICPSCQAQNEVDAKFCEECGGPLARTCPQCQKPLSTKAKFCPSCGRRIAEIETTARFASPDAYTPKHLAEKILTSKAALEGERKQVTVLFADLKGSMELLADRDPEEARKLLDPILERMMEAVHRYEGTVNQVMGDGIMALFGAPIAHEDHAVRACYAALRMQEAVKRDAEEVRRREGVLPQIRVGLNSGEVVVRSIGSDLHMDYTAVGQTTHLAARMEQSAAPGTALISTETLLLAEGYVQVAPLGPINVKGLADAVEAYELTGAVAGRSRFQTLAARGLTKFVGRVSEIEQLATALAQARAGHGQVVAVVGEPGVGKSRLFWEFTHSHRTEGCLTVEAGSVSYGKATSYLPVIELLRAYFQIEARDDQRKIREKVTGKTLSLDRALEPVLSALLALLDVPVEDEQWARLDPPQRRQQTLDAVKRLLLRESHVQPLIVIFEDVHWIDGETQALLDGLLESLPTAKLLLLVNYRPEYAHAWSAKTYYRLLRVDPLPVETAGEVLEALLGIGEELSPLKRLLIDRTQGNPFFLEESVRALVETGALAGDRGSYRLAKPLQMMQVPATAQAILAARIDRLEPEDKRLLQAASVVGKDVPYNLLHAVTNETEDALRLSLARLQAAEFLYETRLFPDLEYTFKHALTHEVAYNNLLQERRRALHARIVGALEALYPNRPPEQVDSLANHAFRGAVWDKAAGYSRQAGARAAARSAHREAVGVFEQALAALAHVPEDRDTLELGIDLRCELRNSLHALEEQARLLSYLQEAEVMADRLGDGQRLGRIANYLCIAFSNMGEHDRAIAAGQRALTLATASGAFDIQVIAQTYLGAAHYRTGDYRQAVDVSRQALEMLTGESRFARFGQVALPAVSSRCILAWSLTELGDFAEGYSIGEEALRLAEAHKQPYDIAITLSSVGLLSRRQGELLTAIPVLERGLELCRTANLARLLPQTASLLASAYVLAGRTAEAILLLDQTMERVASGSGIMNLALVLTELSEACGLVGRVNEARALADRLLETWRGYQAHAYRLLAELATRGEPCALDEGSAYYRQALALAEPQSMRPLVAHCHLGLGKLCRRGDKCQEAQEHLTTATTMYREMGMTYWLEQAEAEMRELGQS